MQRLYLLFTHNHTLIEALGATQDSVSFPKIEEKTRGANLQFGGWSALPPKPQNRNRKGIQYKICVPNTQYPSAVAITRI